MHDKILLIIAMWLAVLLNRVSVFVVIAFCMRIMKCHTNEMVVEMERKSGAWLAFCVLGVSTLWHLKLLSYGLWLPLWCVLFYQQISTVRDDKKYIKHSQCFHTVILLKHDLIINKYSGHDIAQWHDSTSS